MYKVLTLDNIAQSGLQDFPKAAYEVSSETAQPDAIILRSTDLHHYNFANSIQVVGRAGSGVNNLPIEKLTEAGIPILNTPGANANAVCELVLVGMLLAARQLYQAIHYVKELQPNSELKKTIEKNKKQFSGREILGKTLGVIGLGSIGVKVANAAYALGMKVIGYDPHISVYRAWELSANVKPAKSLGDLLSRSDFITLHVPLVPETRHLLAKKQFNLLKSHAVLLNFSRADVIDQTALLDLLNDNKQLRYINDFPHATLKDHPGVISLPHLGASTKEAEENCAHMIVKQIRDYLEQGIIGSSVNFPIVDAPALDHHYRLRIINMNQPNMVAQISSYLGAADINIMSLINQSQQDIAYTLIDVQKAVDNKTLKNIKTITGVKRVQQLAPIND